MQPYLPIISSVILFGAVYLLARSAGGVWDGITRRYIADLQPMLKALAIDQSKISIYLRWWGMSLVGGFLFVTFVLQMPPLSIAAVYLIYVAPRLILQALIERRKTLLRDQMVGASIALANACRAGLSLAQSMETVAGETAEPLATEFKHIVYDYEHGRPLAEAINETKQRLQLDSFTLFASAVLVSLDRGGRVTDSLERISHSLQENQRLERKLDADTASGRWVVWILAAFPFLFLGLFLMLDTQNTLLVFQSLIGQIVLFVVSVIVYVSVRWSQRILAIEM